MKSLDYESFKNLIGSQAIPFVYTENNYRYFMMLETMPVFCELFKNDTANTADFEANYRPLGNITKNVYDDSGRLAVRHHIANKGNSLQCFAFTFTTSDASSLFSMRDDNTTPEAGFTYAMYKANGQTTANNNECVNTRIDIERPFDTEFVGGGIFQKSVPASSVVCYMTAVPDVPANLGGSKMMCQGLDLSFLPGPGKYTLDGRAPLLMKYDAVYHTNKMRFNVYHAAGLQHDLMVRLEYYY